MSENKMCYTEDELIERIWDTENVRHTINRYCYYISNEDPRRAVNELWVSRPENRRTASYAVNSGYYVGLDEVVRHLVLDRSEHLYANLKERSDRDSGVEFSNLNLGYGCATMMTMNTPLIKIADDGRSARFMGYSIGFTADGNADETATAYMVFDRVFADLLKEDGEWRIWHMAVTHDHTMEAGENYGANPVIGWKDPISARDGNPTVEQKVYDPLFGWEYMYQDMPRQYYTYTDKIGCGPNSDLGKPYYEREVH